MSEPTPSLFGTKMALRQILGKPVIWVGVILLTMALAFGCNKLSNTSTADQTGIEQTLKVTPVQVEILEPVDSIMQRRSYTGTIRSRQQSDLAFESGGKVQNIFVDEGKAVEQEQILALLDTETIQAKRDAIQANLEQASALLAELKSGPRSQTIEAARSDLEEAKSNLKIAELNLKRREQLQRQNAISDEEFEQAHYTVQSANARLKSTHERLDELLEGTRPEKIAAQQAAVRQFQASLTEINVQIEKSKLVAPFSGRITRRLLDPGTIVQATQPVLRLVELDHLEAVIGLPVSVAQLISVGDSHTIQIGQNTVNATVLAKIKALEQTTRTQTIVFKLTDLQEAEILPGQLCHVSISSEIDAQGYWLPAGSLSEGVRGLWSMMVVVDDEYGDARASRRDVEVVYTDGNRVLVRGTLSGPQNIITSGTHRIVGGQLVEAIHDVPDRVTKNLDARN